MFRKVKFRNLSVLAFGMTYTFNKTMFLNDGSSPRTKLSSTRVVNQFLRPSDNGQEQQQGGAQTKNVEHENSQHRLNFKGKLKEFRLSNIFEDFSDVFEYTPDKKLKESFLNLGSADKFIDRSFIQIDLETSQKKKKKEFDLNLFGDIDDEDIDPETYFNKLLVYKIGKEFYSTASFCGYDLTDLKDGVFIGDMIICPTCLSEYNVRNGVSEKGPNTKFLAAFPCSQRGNEVLVKLPDGKVPLFSESPKQQHSELDPRHFVLIGDTETTYGALDNLVKVFTGRISIITNQTGIDFIDQQKLSRSFFPVKAKHSRFLDKTFLSNHGIMFFNDKVKQIDSKQRTITLTNGQKIPFDKVLISVGSPKARLLENYTNLFYLYNIVDHAKIHNQLIKKSTTSVVIMGDNIRSVEIASSVRRYLDAIGKENTRVSIVCPNKWFLDKFADSKASEMIRSYLQRNRISVFKDAEVKIEAGEDKVIQNLFLLGKEKVFKVPGQVFIFEGGMSPQSNITFEKNIYIPVAEDQIYSLMNKNVIIPDDRFSLHPSTRYPLVFAAGNCTYVESFMLPGPIRTDSLQANFHLGFLAFLSMFDVHLQYDDILVNSGRFLDSWIHFIGNENLVYDSCITYTNPKKGQFVSYLVSGNKVKGFLVYGFKNLHVYLKLALRMNMIPAIGYLKDNLDTTHLSLVGDVVHRSEEVECYRHKAFAEISTISTYNYEQEDQEITHDLMKRSLSAYNTYKESLDKEYKKKQEEEARKEKKRGGTVEELEERAYKKSPTNLH